MKISIAGMKDIRNAEAVPAGHAIDGPEHLRQSRPGNDGIHGDHVGSEAAHRPKGSFAAEPQSGALVIVLGDSHLISIVAPADFDDRGGGLIQPFPKSIDFDQEGGDGVSRVSGSVYRRLDS